ncbi:hypothetical protein AOZ06_27005 [Kibdelosporangium phytohabitans]|uniref:Restriction endonuclease domain-containing protein n=2 Tax=Kibdelosporangium phytohabitans TaxID=860235 RepID=A0A0N9I2J7_9PSEU|nr:hypothetical protein AOZ06_27005 [Kibdelosporangium phytohabitans]
MSISRLCPGTVRRPELIIVDRADRKRARAEKRILRASEVLLVVETVWPGSRRTDYRIKRDEYAGASRTTGLPTSEPVGLDVDLTALLD